MTFSSFFSSPSGLDTLNDLQEKFADARASLIRIRSERGRLARTGWRPRVPNETKLIRSAEWTVEAATNARGALRGDPVDFDLDSRFVPSESGYSRFVSGIETERREGRDVRVFLRGIELDDPRIAISGRPVCAAFFDLVLALSLYPSATIVLPKVDGYLEARFWAEIGRAIEGGLGLGRDSVRFEAGIDTLGGIVEAEEIVFELKDTLVGIVFDARLDRFDALRLESGTPNLPASDTALDPWLGLEIATRVENLETLSRRRGFRLELRPDGGPLREMAEPISSSILTLDSLHEKARFAFRFLRGWFGGDPLPEGKDWADFELARAILWTAIHSGFLREENYEAWREEFGSQPFESGSVDDAAIRTLDPLVRTAVFPDSAKPLAFTVLLERDKTHSVNSLRHA